MSHNDEKETLRKATWGVFRVVAPGCDFIPVLRKAGISITFDDLHNNVYASRNEVVIKVDPLPAALFVAEDGLQKLQELKRSRPNPTQATTKTTTDMK